MDVPRGGLWSGPGPGSRGVRRRGRGGVHRCPPDHGPGRQGGPVAGPGHRVVGPPGRRRGPADGGAARWDGTGPGRQRDPPRRRLDGGQAGVVAGPPGRAPGGQRLGPGSPGPGGVVADRRGGHGPHHGLSQRSLRPRRPRGRRPGRIVGPPAGARGPVRPPDRSAAGLGGRPPRPEGRHAGGHRGRRPGLRGRGLRGHRGLAHGQLGHHGQRVGPPRGAATPGPGRGGPVPWGHRRMASGGRAVGRRFPAGLDRASDRGVGGDAGRVGRGVPARCPRGGGDTVAGGGPCALVAGGCHRRLRGPALGPRPGRPGPGGLRGRGLGGAALPRGHRPPSARGGAALGTGARGGRGRRRRVGRRGDRGARAARPGPPLRPGGVGRGRPAGRPGRRVGVRSRSARPGRPPGRTATRDGADLPGSAGALRPGGRRPPSDLTGPGRETRRAGNPGLRRRRAVRRSARRRRGGRPEGIDPAGRRGPGRAPRPPVPAAPARPSER